MSGFCVVCRFPQLDTEMRERYARLCVETVESAEFQREECALPWAMASLIRWHLNDPGHILVGNDDRASCIWLGSNASDHGEHDLESLIGKLDRSDVPISTNVQPPFACCILDGDLRTLWMVADPHGLQPIYYTLNRGTFGACTRVAPLVRAGIARSRLDQRALMDFFAFEHLTGDRTFEDGVRVLMPGSILRFRDGHLTMRSYLDSRGDESVPQGSVRETAEALYGSLCGSVAHCVSDHRRVAVTLSGGLDSRALLGCAVSRGIKTIAYTFGHSESCDIKCAADVARVCGVSHRVIPALDADFPMWVDHGIRVTDGMVNCVHYHILALREVLRNEADVVLDGLGGDALTGGHLKWRMVCGGNADRVIDHVYRQRATCLATEEHRREFFEPDFLSAIDYDPKDAVRSHFVEVSPRSLWRGAHRFDLEERQRRFIQYGPHLLRPFVDVRTPFYGSDVVQLLRGVPVTQLLEQRAYVLMHSHHLHELARVPDAARSIPVSWPQPVRFGKKVVDFLGRRLDGLLGGVRKPQPPPVIDYRTWFRGPLHQYLRERILDNRRITDGILRPVAVERLLQAQVHANSAACVACVLSFVAWREATRT